MKKVNSNPVNKSTENGSVNDKPKQTSWLNYMAMKRAAQKKVEELKNKEQK